MTESGTAAAANEAAMGSLSAKMTQLGNVWGKLAVDMSGPLMNSLKLVVDAFIGVGNALDWVNTKFGPFLDLMNRLNPVTGPLVTIIDQLSYALYGAGQANEKLQTATNDATEKMASQNQTVSSVDDAIKGLINRSATLKDNHVSLQAEVLIPELGECDSGGVAREGAI